MCMAMHYPLWVKRNKNLNETKKGNIKCRFTRKKCECPLSTFKLPLMFVHSHMHTDRDDNVPLKLLKIQNAESERRGNEKKLNFNSTIWRNIENTKVDDNKGRKTHRRNKRTSKIVWELRAHNNQKKLFNMKKQRHTKHKKPNEQPDRFSISLLIFFSVRSLCVPTNFCSLHLLNFFVFFFVVGVFITSAFSVRLLLYLFVV